MRKGIPIRNFKKIVDKDIFKKLKKRRHYGLLGNIK
jgi:ribosomal protein S21